MSPNGEIDRHTCTSENSVESTVNIADRLYLFINGQWYDLTQWQHTHPGGSEILENLNGRDATDAFYSLHSKEALKRLSCLKPCSSLHIQSILPIIEPTNLTLSFRQLRENLINNGYFNRSIFWELFYHLSVYFLCLFGTFCYFYWGYNILAILIIGFGMQQAGWIGHDYAHGRGTWMRWLCRTLSGSINAFSPTWWSHKHNTHHIYTNHIGIDTDVANDPIFHLFFPSNNKDVWFRAYQHWYFIPVYSLLYLSWRWQSFQHSFNTYKYFELSLMLPNYIWLYMLGWQVALGSILVGGFLVACIVTATHQSEEMLIDSHYPFVETQFLTTCDAYCNNIFMEWLWGGMQYQLEHHLFPTMPKYNYARLRPILQRWTKENGIRYRCESVWSIWHRNYLTLKHFAGRTKKT
ncbi:unnamed protein product [Rotaria sp. Silwood2]|nr:unnamed protein product [Rotaria sp. Silwood2]CAF2943735.1 unnamed protein product [Rotaria sp. Silwood2]CAF3136181.1 unnamed protein product [Rotaria sp. Silwood2]CAF3307312.1 unnamed protein product [Rotaria sp. Silwood2]CAF4125089.1 unnamed protein product [Rotaria sp. Silwood2]